MPKQTRPDDDKTVPNRSANMKKAEGSRENFEGSDKAGGITNRPLADETREQDEVPPRGRNKEGGHA